MSVSDLESPPFQQKLLQIKLFNGVLAFSEKEYEGLNQWLDTPEKRTEILDILENQILNLTPNKLAGFKRSRLRKFLSSGRITPSYYSTT